MLEVDLKRKEQLETFQALLPKARKIAASYQRRLGPEIGQDALVAAMEGLWVAILKEPRPEHFENYAITRIRGSIQDELRRQDWASRRMRKAGVPEIHYVDCTTFDIGVGAHWSEEYLAYRTLLDTASQVLSEKEYSVLLKRLQGEDLQGIAHHLQVSESRASQVLKRAVSKIQAHWQEGRGPLFVGDQPLSGVEIQLDDLP